MNQNFNLNRFGILLRLHFAQNGKSQLLSAGLIIGLMLVLMIPMLLTEKHSHMAELLHVFAFFLCVMLGGNLFASSAFSQYSNPESGIPAVTLPASRPEKFLVIFFTSLFFVTLFVVLFWQLHFLIVELANQRLFASSDFSGGRIYHKMSFYSGTGVYFTAWYFIIYTGVFLGSIYFPKNSFVKSVAILLLLTIMAFFLHYGLAYHFTSSPSLWTFPFSSWNIVQNKEYTVDFPEAVGKLMWPFLVILVLGFWYTAYVRFKEKEI